MKKRGQRRTASDRVGRWGELFFYLFFFIAGGLVLGWHVAWVMLPDWKALPAAEGLRPATCRLIDKRISPRETLKGYDYRAELRLAPVEGGNAGNPEWTHDGTGEYSPNRDDAQRTLERYEIGQNYACWIDPTDPSRILLGRDYRWWPWLVALIPTSLMVFGAIGAARTVRQWNASSEWQAVSQQMSSFDIRAVQPVTGPTLDAVPSVDRVIDSPGVRLAHRLPIDGSPNWRLAAMAAVCLCWNGLVVVFVERLLVQYLNGTANWLIAAIVIPFTIAGVWLIVLLVREAWSVVGIGTTQLEISHHPLQAGGQCDLFLIQSGQMTVKQLTVSLICEERAVYREGTDTREWVEPVYRECVLRERNFTIEHGQPFESQFSMGIPAQSMHSFRSRHNEVRWLLEVCGTTHRWPEFQRRFPIYVYPEATTPTDYKSPAYSHDEPRVEA
ncbi:MAG: hypothetical protein WD851_12465 [Pirellulales bacterium]